MTKVTCDRCKSEHTPTEVEIVYAKDGDFVEVVPKFDLCGRCRTQLRQLLAKWLKGNK